MTLRMDVQEDIFVKVQSQIVNKTSLTRTHVNVNYILVVTRFLIQQVKFRNIISSIRNQFYF